MWSLSLNHVLHTLITLCITINLFMDVTWYRQPTINKSFVSKTTYVEAKKWKCLQWFKKKKHRQRETNNKFSVLSLNCHQFELLLPSSWDCFFSSELFQGNCWMHSVRAPPCGQISERSSKCPTSACNMWNISPVLHSAAFLLIWLPSFTFCLFR